MNAKVRSAAGWFVLTAACSVAAWFPDGLSRSHSSVSYASEGTIDSLSGKRVLVLGEIKGTSLDIGAINSTDSHLTLRFWQKNPYDKEVHIDSVRVSCSCFKAVPINDTIPQGGKLEFRVTLDLTNEAALDEVSFAVKFKGSWKPIVYRIKYQRPRPPFATPSSIAFGSHAKVGDTRRVRVRTVVDAEVAEISLSDRIICSDSRIDCKLLEENTRSRGENQSVTEYTAMIEASINESAESSRAPLAGNVLVKLGINGKDSQLQIPVHGELQPPISLRPSTVFIVVKDPPSDKKLSARVRIHAAEGGPTTANFAVSSGDPRVKASLEKGTAAGAPHLLGEVAITVDVSDGASFDTDVTIKDRSDESRLTLKVPVKVRVPVATGDATR